MLLFLKSKNDFDDSNDEEEKIKIADGFYRFLQFFGYLVPIGEKLNVLRIACVFASMHPITVGLFTFLFHFLNYNKFQLNPLGDTLAGIASVSMAFFINYTFLINSDGIHRLLEELSCLNKDQVPKDWYQDHRMMNYYIKLLFVFLLSMAAAIIGILLLQKCEDGEASCGLLISGRIPHVNVYTSPNRQIFMVVQTVNAFQNGLLSSSVAGIFIVISRCLVLLIQQLEEMFKEIPKLPDRATRKSQIKMCVLYHYKILELRDKFAEYSTDTHFYILFFTSINISLNAYNVFLEIRLQMVLHLLIYLLFVFLISFAGEQLIGASDHLCGIIYQSIPFDGDNQTANDLRFILLCSSRGIFIPAGKLAKVGLERLQDLMSKSYSYFTMLVNT